MDGASQTFSLTVTNMTPLQLLLQQSGSAGQALPPYGQVTCAARQDEPIQCVDPATSFVVHASQASAYHPVVKVTAEGLRSRPRGAASGLGKLQVLNATKAHVDIFLIDPEGVERQAGSQLARGKDATVETALGDLWAFRATFTGELLGLYLATAAATQTFKVVQVPRPLPSPQPGICKDVKTIGDVRAKPKRESRDYICISETRNPPRDRFNTRTNVVTRNVKIAGATVAWTTGSGLLSYCGEDVIDIAAMDIYADRVEIGSPIRLPGTKVTIHAREVEFFEDGCIDTTPTSWQAPAVSSRRVTVGGFTVPADASGKPTWVGESGQAGADAGDITLFVQTLIAGEAGMKRLIARGGQGQTAEAGGHVPYSEKKPEAYRPAPSSEHGKNLPSVSAGEINALVRKISKGVSYWRWPSGTSADDMTVPGDALRKAQVTHATVYTFDGSALFPSAPGMNYLPDRRGAPEYKGWKWPGEKGSTGKPLAETDTTRLRPGDGEDAYPGGTPGKGGNAGNITATIDDARLQTIADATAGEPGKETPKVEGLDPGTPNPAFWIGICLVLRTPPIESKWSPGLDCIDVTAKAGKDAGPVQGQAGQKGTIAAKQDRAAWLTSIALGCVLNLANDAYRNGHRDLARDVLEPYFIALRDAKQRGALSSDLLGQFVTIDSMRVRMANNLDYMGKPLGWLPRLNLASDLDIVLEMRRVGSEVLYFSDAALKDFATLQDKSQLLRATSQAIESEMKAASDLLHSEYEALKAAQEALQKAVEAYGTKKAELDALRDAVQAQAQDDVAEQHAFKAFMKITAGATKAIPLGQPFTGLAGSALDSFSDFDWNAEDLGGQIGKSLGKVGDATSKFIKENEDLLIKSASEEASERRVDLTDRINAASRNIEKVDSKIAAYKDTIESRWSKERTAEIDAQKVEINRLDAQIAAANEKVAALNTKLAKAKLEALEKVELAKTEKELELAEKAAQQAEAKRAARIALQEAKAAGVVAAKARLEKAQQDLKDKASGEALELLRGPVTELNELTNQKADVEQEIATRESSRKKLLESLAGVGDGIGLIGEGIAAAMSPVTPGSDEVQALTERLLTSKFSANYVRLKSEFEELNAKKAAAVAALASHQQNIIACTAQLATNLAERAALSQQMQGFDDALDVSVQSYLRGMSQRARDNLRWSLYHFAKAYQYEYLRDVSDEFFNLDKWVDKLRDYAAKRNKLLGRDDFSKADFDTVEKAAFDDQFATLARDIINRRQQYNSGAELPLEVALSETQRSLLNKNGSISFNLVRDFDKGSFSHVDMRIVALKLTTLKFVKPVPDHTSFEIAFKHSGESIILGHSNDYYYFRAAEGDDVISWNFTYNVSAAVDGANGIDAGKPSERSKQEAALLKKLLGSEVDQRYQAYFPSFFSDITLQINPGHFKQGAVPEIADLAFLVTFSSGGSV